MSNPKHCMRCGRQCKSFQMGNKINHYCPINSHGLQYSIDAEPPKEAPEQVNVPTIGEAQSLTEKLAAITEELQNKVGELDKLKKLLSACLPFLESIRDEIIDSYGVRPEDPNEPIDLSSLPPVRKKDFEEVIQLIGEVEQILEISEGAQEIEPAAQSEPNQDPHAGTDQIPEVPHPSEAPATEEPAPTAEQQTTEIPIEGEVN